MMEHKFRKSADLFGSIHQQREVELGDFRFFDERKLGVKLSVFEWLFEFEGALMESLKYARILDPLFNFRRLFCEVQNPLELVA